MAERKIPLCVDLDGTLIRTDLLHEATLDLLRQPGQLVRLPGWLRHGKAGVKHRVATVTDCDAGTLPYRVEVMNLIAEAKAEGREVALVTAAAPQFAQSVAKHLGVFDHVISSDQSINLAADAKARKLVTLFGEGGFDYVGNGRADIAVWNSARQAIAVTSDKRIIRSLARRDGEHSIIAPGHRTAKAVVKSLRPHQWVKNLLIFVPLLAGHQLTNVPLLIAAIQAFAAFCFAASLGYIVNDLLDVKADRAHTRKRSRPFASGDLSSLDGIALIAALVAVIAVLASSLPFDFALVLLFYLVATLSYSIRLKRQVILDIVLLAGLYTLRIIAGSAATGIEPSFWLLAFSMFIFLSLAVVKRYSELRLALDAEKVLPGRGYRKDDLPVLMAIGAGSGLMAVMVLALYLNSPDVVLNYAQPGWLWLACPIALYWVSRLWMKTHRGEVHDDPVVFAVRDWQSILTAVVIGLLFVLASLGAPRI